MTLGKKLLVAAAVCCILVLTVLVCAGLGLWRLANQPACSTTLVLVARDDQQADVSINGRPVGKTPVEIDLEQLRALLASGSVSKAWAPGKGTDITSHFRPGPGASQDLPRVQIWDEAVVPEAREGYENILHVSVGTADGATTGVLRVRMTDPAGRVGVRWGAHRFYGWVQRRSAQRIQVEFELRAPTKGSGEPVMPVPPPGLK